MAKISSPNDYRENLKKIREIELPSGVIFKLKRLLPSDLLKAGFTDLPSLFSQYIEDDDSDEDAQKKLEENQKAIKRYNEYMRYIIDTGIIEPKVDFEYIEEDKEEILFWNDIEQNDQNFIINYILGRDSKNA